MPRRAQGLTARQVREETRPLVGDGGGLYMQVKDGSRTWVFRFQIAGRRRTMGLGAITDMSIDQARRRARELRHLVREGVDPIDRRQAAGYAVVHAITFSQCAEAYIEAHRAGWRNPKHAAQWANTLSAYAYPAIGDLPVRAVDTALVMKCLTPIWTAKTETAARVRGRIETILDWAKASGHRQGENPARWKGHLENLLPKNSHVRQTKHHAALPYTEINEFAADLRQYDGINARALEFAMLCGARTGEVIHMKWPEVDLAKRLWTVPAERMKMKKEHRVPLSDRAFAIIKEMAAIRTSDYVFPGKKPNRPLGDNALLQMIKRMGRKGAITTHGFRSTFSDWCAEQTHFPEEVRKMAIAHAVGDKVEAAYRRGDLFQKRRQLMDAWSNYIDRPAEDGTVVPLVREAA
jgi:integrase